MERWIGKVAVVTGASSGIGKDVAETLAKKGVVVVGLARRVERIQELANSVTGTIHAVKCDVTSEEDIQKAFRWIETNLGGVDILINNAGASKNTHICSGDTAEWKRILDVNVMGLCICTREAMKTMRDRGDDGCIININSILGHYVSSYKNMPLGIYTASKHAVTSLVESLRFELQDLNSNIKVTSISPGMVMTEMLRGAVENRDVVNIVSHGKGPLNILDPADITDAIIYVLSTRPKVQVHELMIQPIGQRLN